LSSNLGQIQDRINKGGKGKLDPFDDLAMMQPCQSFFEVRAPRFLQKQILLGRKSKGMELGMSIGILVNK